VSAVVDGSVLVAATTDAGPDGTWAESVLAEGGIVAPHLVLVEATSILRRLEGAKQLTRLEATAAQRDLLGLDMFLVPFEPFAERVWELRRNVTSYDAWYVAVAEAFDLPLATLDRRLGRAAAPPAAFGCHADPRYAAGGGRHASARSAERVMRQLPYASIVARWPGYTTIVVNGSSMIAGPRMAWPGVSRGPSQIGVAT
jgi:predicted nucleic acid-binding protein